MTVTIPKGTTGDMTFTPNPLWHVFTITLNPNGGFYNNSASIYSEEILYGELFTLNDATSNEFEFIGWFNEEGAKIITPTFNMTEDINLTAHWSCDLTIDIGDIGARIYSIDDQID
jgi:uncharacterized repeat protein (TIGR02543 family)